MKTMGFLLLVSALVTSVYYNFRQSNDLRKAREELRELRTDLRADDANLTREKEFNTREMAEALQKLRDLRGSVDAQAQETEAARQKLLDAKANFRESQEPEPLGDALQQEKTYIEELEANLKSVRQKQSRLGTQGKLNRDQQKWQQSEGDSDLTAQIQAQKKLVQESLEKVNQLKGRVDFSGKQEFQEAKTELKAQRAALSQLTEQKKTLNQQWNAERSLTHDSAQVQQRKLKQSEGQIQQALRQERNRLQAMQKEQGQRARDRQGKQGEIQRLAAEFQAQKTKLEQLQSELAEQEKKFKKISQNR